jgi:hypothetical protein
MKILPDDVRGDAPMRLAIRHRVGMHHEIALFPVTVCFATSTMLGTHTEDDDAPGSGEPKPGRPIPSACAACKVQNEDDAKFCKGCGASMATRAEDDDKDGDDDPPSSKDPDSDRDGAAQPPPKLAAKHGPDAAYAELAGVSASASIPAIKAALARKTNALNHIMTALDLTDEDRAVSAFDVIIKENAEIPGLKKQLRQHDRRAKLELGKKIVALGIEGYPRSDVLEDVLVDGKRVVQLTREYREMSLAALDEKHKRLDARAPARRTTPFEPDAARAKEAAAHGGLARAGRVEAAKKLPGVLALSRDPGAGGAP